LSDSALIIKLLFHPNPLRYLRERFLAAIQKPGYLALFALAFCCLTCCVALNNGFIEDDFVLLDETQSFDRLITDGFQAPQCFRVTTFLFFWFLQHILGGASEAGYTVSILLHFVNCLLLAKLVAKVSGRRLTGALAGLLFATIQNPQEAIYWLAAVNELLVGFFILLALNLELSRKIAGTLVAMALALISKESGLLICVLLPIAAWQLLSGRDKQRWIMIAVPPVVGIIFCSWFIYTLKHNVLAGGHYSLNVPVIRIVFSTLHKLLFPWVYLAIVLAIVRWRFPKLRMIWPAVVLLVLTILPYSFLTYQRFLPSRNTYLASMCVCGLFAILLVSMRRRILIFSIFLIFSASNIYYAIARKDGQFEYRGAPTNQLIRKLESVPADRIRIELFPGNPWIVKLAARQAAGWENKKVLVDGLDKIDPDSISLRWKPEDQDYILLGPH
jgi:hypothetical protein